MNAGRERDRLRDGPAAAIEVIQREDDELMLKTLEAIDAQLPDLELDQRVAFVLKYRREWRNEDIDQLISPSQSNKNPDAVRKRVERLVKVQNLMLKAKLARNTDQPPPNGDA